MNCVIKTMGLLGISVIALGLNGCGNTKWADRKASEAMEEAPYSGFNEKAAKPSERKGSKYEVVSDDTEPVKAVEQLVAQLQSQERHVSIPAEDELRYWASKQGVPPLIVERVRPLLRNPRIEVRAPALRLTVAYGKKESMGDLIEVLEDSEYGMRTLAFKALRARSGNDFGYNPAGGELLRAQSIERWRQWHEGEGSGKTKNESLEAPGEKAAMAEPNRTAAPPANNFVTPVEDAQPKAAEIKKFSEAEVLLPAPKEQPETR